MPIELLGIDNVLFDVDDLDAAVAFYEVCGFGYVGDRTKRALPSLSIARETPGLLIRRHGARGTGRLWVEVADADRVAVILEAKGIQTIRIETATGVTRETRDPSGNHIGFADYTRDRSLGRRS